MIFFWEEQRPPGTVIKYWNNGKDKVKKVKEDIKAALNKNQNFWLCTKC